MCDDSHRDCYRIESEMNNDQIHHLNLVDYHLLSSPVTSLPRIIIVGMATKFSLSSLVIIFIWFC